MSEKVRSCSVVSPPAQAVEYWVVYSPNSPVSVQYLKHIYAIFPRLTQSQQCQRVVVSRGNVHHKQRTDMSQVWNFLQFWDPLDFNSFLAFLRAGVLCHPWDGWSQVSGDGVRKKDDTQPFELLIQRVTWLSWAVLVVEVLPEQLFCFSCARLQRREDNFSYSSVQLS